MASAEQYPRGDVVHGRGGETQRNDESEACAEVREQGQKGHFIGLADLDPHWHEKLVGHIKEKWYFYIYALFSST